MGTRSYSYYLVNADGTTQETTAEDPNAVAIANSESLLYTAAGSYANTVSIDRAEYEAAGVVPGFTLPVQLTVTNRGIDPITGLTVTIGEETVQTVQDVSLAPGQNLTLTVNYTVPSAVKDVDCTVQATFSGGGTMTSEPVTLTLSTPDVGISRMELVEQQDGRRTIQVALYNDGEVPLDSARHTVKAALFSDAACENHISEQPVVLADSDLEMVNDGGYTTQLTFDVKDAFADALQDGEIPEGGLQIYAKVWIEAKQSLGTQLAHMRAQGPGGGAAHRGPAADPAGLAGRIAPVAGCGRGAPAPGRSGP